MCVNLCSPAPFLRICLPVYYGVPMCYGTFFFLQNFRQSEVGISLSSICHMLMFCCSFGRWPFGPFRHFGFMVVKVHSSGEQKGFDSELSFHRTIWILCNGSPTPFQKMQNFPPIFSWTYFSPHVSPLRRR